MRLSLRVMSSCALLFLAACAPDVQPTVHEIYLYGLGGENVRYSVFYGSPTQFTIDGETVELTEGSVESPFSLPGSLLVDGAPHLMASVDAIDQPVAASRIPLTTSFQVQVDDPLEGAVYFDGQMWLTLLDEAAAGMDLRVAPKPRIGRLRGVGGLSVAEGAALADFLESQGTPLVVAELPSDRLPERSIDGLAEYRATGLYVQDVLTVDSTAYRAPAEQLTWEVLAEGDQAVGVEGQAFRLVENERELLALWNQVWGARLELPPVPDVDFERETILAVFQGQQSTGGHGIEISEVTFEGDDVFVDMRFLEPAADAIVTQALTSPWVMIRVLRGGIDVAWFRNPQNGELFGVARSGQ